MQSDEDAGKKQKKQKGKERKDRRRSGETRVHTAQGVGQEVRSVPESFLRQSVSATVWPAAGEKHFRGGKKRRQQARKHAATAPG